MDFSDRLNEDSNIVYNNFSTIYILYSSAKKIAWILIMSLIKETKISGEADKLSFVFWKQSGRIQISKLLSYEHRHQTGRFSKIVNATEWTMLCSGSI